MIIKNNRLTVEIDETNKLYEGVRFDNLGTISQVTLDDKYTFLTSEFTDERFPLGGIGLSNEFKPIITENEFMKIGVGVLNIEGNYDFMHKYDCDYANMSTTIINDHAIKFTAVHHDSFYDFTYTKTISILENKLRYDYEIVNTGKNTLKTIEYCHNFVNLNGNEVGEGYYFTAPCDLADSFDVQELSPKGNQVDWDNYSGKTFFLGNKTLNEKTNGWKLVNTKDKLTMTETIDKELVLFYFWGQSHVISAEMFVDINVAPSCNQTWSREFSFIKE